MKEVPMNANPPGHPESETLAAYVDGTLLGQRKREIERHLRDCSDCRQVWHETDIYLLQNRPPREPRKEADSALTSVAIGFGLVLMIGFLLGALWFIVMKADSFHAPVKQPRRITYMIPRTT